MSRLFNFDVSVVFHFVVVVAVGGDHNVSGGVGLNFFRRFSILKQSNTNFIKYAALYSGKLALLIW